MGHIWSYLVETSPILEKLSLGHDIALNLELSFLMKVFSVQSNAPFDEMYSTYKKYHLSTMIENWVGSIIGLLRWTKSPLRLFMKNKAIILWSGQEILKFIW